MAENIKFRVVIQNDGKGALRGIQNDLRDLGNAADNAADTGSNAFSTFQGTLAGILAGGVITGIISGLGEIASAAADVGKQILSFAGDNNQAQRDIQAQFGLTQDRATELGKIAQGVFTNNFGDSIGEATKAVALVDQRLGEMVGNDALGSITEQAFSLKDAFGIELTESVGAVKSLMDNFGIDGQQAIDLITTGLQNGLNSSGDFLDSIKEYAPQFNNGEAKADEFFSVLNTGFQDGILGTDKAADMFKEFVLRIQDGSTLTTESLQSLGLNADEILSGLADGTLRPIDAFQMVIDKLGETDNTALAMQAGVGLLGTQFEDMGLAAVTGVNIAEDALETMAGSTAGLTVQYETFGAVWDTLWRNLLVILEPIGAALLDLASVAMPLLLQGLETIAPYIENFANSFSVAIGGIEQFVQSILTNWDTVEADTDTTFGAINQTVTSLLSATSEFITSTLTIIRDFWATHGDDIMETAQMAWQSIEEIITLSLELIDATIGEQLRAISSFIDAHGDEIQTILSAVWSFIEMHIRITLNVIKGILQAAIAVMTGDFSAYADYFRGATEELWTAIQDIWTSATNGIQNALQAAWEGIQSATSATFASLRDATSLFWDTIQEIWNTAVQTVKSVTDTTFAAIQSAITLVMNGIDAVIREAWALIQGGIESSMMLIQGVIETGWGIIQDVVTAASTILTDTLSILADFIGTVFDTPVTLARNILSNLSRMLDTTVTGAAHVVTGAINGAIESIGRISGAVSGAIGSLTNLANRLSSIAIPSWLKGHSPPPMADWFTFITGEVDTTIETFGTLSTTLMGRVHDGLVTVKDALFLMHGETDTVIESTKGLMGLDIRGWYDTHTAGIDRAIGSTSGLEHEQRRLIDVPLEGYLQSGTDAADRTSGTMASLSDVLREGVRDGFLAIKEAVDTWDYQLQRAMEKNREVIHSAQAVKGALDAIPRNVNVNIRVSSSGGGIPDVSGGGGSSTGGGGSAASQIGSRIGATSRPRSRAGAQTALVAKGKNIGHVTNNYYVTANYKNTQRESSLRTTMRTLSLLG